MYVLAWPRLNDSRICTPEYPRDERFEVRLPNPGVDLGAVSRDIMIGEDATRWYASAEWGIIPNRKFSSAVYRRRATAGTIDLIIAHNLVLKKAQRRCQYNQTALGSHLALVRVKDMAAAYDNHAPVLAAKPPPATPPGHLDTATLRVLALGLGMNPDAENELLKPDINYIRVHERQAP